MKLYGLELVIGPAGAAETGGEQLMFKAIVDRFAEAVESGEPDRIAGLFSEEGIYHDLVYGDFRGRAAIAGMFRDRWFRDAGRFQWEMLDPIFRDGVGYAHWLHSFDLKNPTGRQRVIVDGASQFVIGADGLIERYREWTEGFGALLRAGASQSTIDFIMYRHDDKVRALADPLRHDI